MGWELSEYLPAWARTQIQARLNRKNLPSPLGRTEATERLYAPGACFVTLTRNGSLRGCIGSLSAHRPLWEDARENALAAAFGDPRFSPVSLAEEPALSLSVSVLSPPLPLKIDGPEELTAYLERTRPGLVLSGQGRKATFLPQVWEQLPRPEEFLNHLCAKAGLPPAYWRDGQPQLDVYTVEEWKEERDL